MVFSLLSFLVRQTRILRAMLVKVHGAFSRASFSRTQARPGIPFTTTSLFLRPFHNTSAYRIWIYLQCVSQVPFRSLFYPVSRFSSLRAYFLRVVRWSVERDRRGLKRGRHRWVQVYDDKKNWHDKVSYETANKIYFLK